MLASIFFINPTQIAMSNSLPDYFLFVIDILLIITQTYDVELWSLILAKALNSGWPTACSKTNE